MGKSSYEKALLRAEKATKSLYEHEARGTLDRARLQLLLEKKADINGPNPSDCDDDTLLHRAVCTPNHVKNVQLLLEFKATPDILTIDRETTPLMRAANVGTWRFKDVATLRNLLDAKADVNALARGWPIKAAADSSLYRKNSVIGYRSPLQMASSVQYIEFLLEHGAGQNLAEPPQNTALMLHLLSDDNDNDGRFLLFLEALGRVSATLRRTILETKNAAGQTAIDVAYELADVTPPYSHTHFHDLLIMGADFRRAKTVKYTPPNPFYSKLARQTMTKVMQAKGRAHGGMADVFCDNLPSNEHKNSQAPFMMTQQQKKQSADTPANGDQTQRSAKNNKNKNRKSRNRNRRGRSRGRGRGRGGKQTQNQRQDQTGPPPSTTAAPK
jgi:hypothetical protein